MLDNFLLAMFSIGTIFIGVLSIYGLVYMIEAAQDQGSRNTCIQMSGTSDCVRQWVPVVQPR